ncbi:hypothetical protein KIN20_015087 [Parelaphostrongylus tenuis]|uniref:Uncharacterized protein n=1 Tax=Parelaphostrongylus tenuis TaxID=148309 RepID=A0AAD5N3U8_PARTN|nr:hypothetical protein KIN20_015087 [Parelaphostrongylus tenuis]
MITFVLPKAAIERVLRCRWCGQKPTEFNVITLLLVLSIISQFRVCKEERLVFARAKLQLVERELELQHFTRKAEAIIHNFMKSRFILVKEIKSSLKKAPIKNLVLQEVFIETAAKDDEKPKNKENSG